MVLCFKSSLLCIVQGNDGIISKLFTAVKPIGLRILSPTYLIPIEEYRMIRVLNLHFVCYHYIYITFKTIFGGLNVSRKQMLRKNCSHMLLGLNLFLLKE